MIQALFGILTISKILVVLTYGKDPEASEESR